MKFNFKNLIFVVIILVFSSCIRQNGKAYQERKDEIIAIHDEVMPKMGDLKELKKEVLAKIQELSKDSIQQESKIKELNILAQDLDKAFDGMFIWMRQFQSSFDEMEDEEIDLYLNKQKEMVEKVNADIKYSILSARSELGKK